jgi:hypothetical protein
VRTVITLTPAGTRRVFTSLPVVSVGLAGRLVGEYERKTTCEILVILLDDGFTLPLICEIRNEIAA